MIAKDERSTARYDALLHDPPTIWCPGMPSNFVGRIAVPTRTAPRSNRFAGPVVELSCGSITMNEKIGSLPDITTAPAPYVEYGIVRRNTMGNTSVLRNPSLRLPM